MGSRMRCFGHSLTPHSCSATPGLPSIPPGLGAVGCPLGFFAWLTFVQEEGSASQGGVSLDPVHGLGWQGK